MAIESKMLRGPIGMRPAQEPKKARGWLWIGLLLVALIVVGAWYFFMNKQTDSTSTIASGDYQAVFLDNGQVYFGKLETSNSVFYSLTDVFYLQTGAGSIDQSASLALTKLGSEAHGPEDKMEINVEHILFIEEMKNDSKVVQAIQDYKSKK